MQRLIRRAAERLREAGDERQRQDVPDLDDVRSTSGRRACADVAIWMYCDASSVLRRS